MAQDPRSAQWASFQKQESVVIVSFAPQRSPTPQEFEGFLGAFERTLSDARDPLFLVFDTRGAARPSMSQLMRKVAFLKSKQELIKDSVHSCATIVESSLMRGAIEMLFKWRPPVRPHQLFPDEAAAAQWLKKQQTVPVG